MIKTSSSLIAFAFVSSASLALAQAPAAKPAAPAAAAAPAHAAPAAKPAAPAAAAAAAPAAAAPAMPTGPSPEVDTLFKAYDGSWKCDTTFAPGSMGPGSPEMKTKSSVKIKKDLGGAWYRGEYEIKKTKAMPGFKGVFMLGYDAGSKAALNVSYDNMGGATLGSAAGATPASITFVGEGYMMGSKVKTRETMTVKSPKEVEHKFEVDMGKGFSLMGTDECKK